jgi:1,2-diacylglycerol 3-alpha-glucosyltransferase
MNILIVNPSLFSAEGDIIPEVKTIKQTMIYAMCLGFIANGHRVTLATAAEFKPVPEEKEYDFEVLFFKSALTGLFIPNALPLSFAFYKYLKNNHEKFDLVLCSEVFSIYSLFASLVCPSKTAIWQEMAFYQQRFKKIPSRCWYRIIIPLFMRQITCVIPRSEKARLFIGKYLKNVYLDGRLELSNNRALFAGKEYSEH